MEDLVGWAASLILLATLVRQIVKQAKDANSEGVSTWLFIGQATASVLFVVYSVMVGNTVFVVTNSCILVTALVGQWIHWRKRRRTAARDVR
ncbi:PQ-loop domain-containing transporter [Pseudoxanthomonas suwonensis]|uniref:PQ-loop domain-containing transporter n=1 Tax=Pseudoxanthomonas suwonensis TaxID=314722 RepID=UPI00046746CD|nr:PQ-loop domain-containing transporter [Pseudoxanthomonas suwonensis]